MSTIHGGFKTETAALTASAATSAAIDKRGYAFGTVSNESGGSVAITYYSSTTPGGTPLALYDKAGSAVTQTVGDDECHELPPAVAGCSYIIPVAGSGTPSLTFHFER